MVMAMTEMIWRGRGCCGSGRHGDAEDGGNNEEEEEDMIVVLMMIMMILN